MDTSMLNIPELSSTQIILYIGLVVWEMVRKGIALYKAGQKSDYIRFIIIFIFNTCGILPILYLIFNKKNNNK